MLYYAKRGNLRNYLEQHYGEFDWIHKLGILKQIAEGLKKIHQAGFVHKDFHSGNILQGTNAEIADLGFTGPADKKVTSTSNRAIYGVLPYISPEVLRGKRYTCASCKKFIENIFGKQVIPQVRSLFLFIRRWLHDTDTCCTGFPS